MGLKKLDSEYKSHFKTFAVHRPVTTKAKVVSHPPGSAPEELESSRRAGLMSSQFTRVSEPALQRKKIVPYKHNHNILATSTVKELNDGEWLETVGSDDESLRSALSHTKIATQNKVRTKREKTEHDSHFARHSSKKDSPIIAADKARTKTKSEKEQSKDKRPSAKKLQGKQERSPERLPPAGRPTYISHPNDKRLLRPSDSSAYLTFPEDNPRKTETEYSERYDSAAPRSNERRPKDEESSYIDAATYKEVLLHRSDAYGLPSTPNTFPAKTSSTRARDKHPITDKQLVRKIQEKTRKNSLKSESQSTVCSERNDRKTEGKSDKKRSHKVKESPGPRRDEAKIVKNLTRRLSLDGQSLLSEHSARSYEGARKSESGRAKVTECHEMADNRRNPKPSKEKTRKSRRRAWEGSSASSVNGNNNDSARGIRGIKGTREELVDRGRSPTPEMRNVGQSRRHHLDVTTGSNNPLASTVDRYRTRILDKVPETRSKPRIEYDPSRYSDTGDSYSYSRSLASWTDQESVDSRSLTATTRSSKRSN